MARRFSLVRKNVPYILSILCHNITTQNNNDITTQNNKNILIIWCSNVIEMLLLFCVVRKNVIIILCSNVIGRMARQFSLVSKNVQKND